MWHVLFECPTTVQGELALKAWSLRNGRAGAGTRRARRLARLSREDRRFLFDRPCPGRRAGARAADLVCLEYEKELDADLLRAAHALEDRRRAEAGVIHLSGASGGGGAET